MHPARSDKTFVEPSDDLNRSPAQNLESTSLHHQPDNDTTERVFQSSSQEQVPSDLNRSNQHRHGKGAVQALSPSPETAERARDFEKALRLAREHFSAQASKLVDTVRQKLQLYGSANPQSESYRLYELLSPLFETFERSHDAYGVLEVEYESFIERIGREAAQSVHMRPSSPRKRSHSRARSGNLDSQSESLRSYTSESSLWDPDMVDVDLLTRYVDKLAEADYFYELSRDSLATKEELFASFQEREPSGPGVSTFSADLALDIDRTYLERLKLSQDAAREAQDLHDQLYQAGLVVHSKVFDSPITLLPWNAPPRSPLLLPLEKSMNGEPLDQIISSHVDRINKWFLDVLQRSAILVLLFKGELVEKAHVRDGEETPALLDLWNEDTATERLSEMTKHLPCTPGSTPISNRSSQVDVIPMISDAIQLSSEDTHTYGTGQQFSSISVNSTLQQPHTYIDEQEILELFGDIDEASLPVVNLESKDRQSPGEQNSHSSAQKRATTI